MGITTQDTERKEEMDTPIDREPFRVFCPHCHREVEIRLGVKLKSLLPGSGEASNESAARSALTDQQRSFLEAAEQNGMLRAFAFAVQNGPMAGHAPKDMDLFLLNFLRSAKPKVIPKAALDILLDDFGRCGRLEFFSAQGVGVVTIDRRIRGFVPVQIVCGESVTGANRAIKYRLETDHAELREWIRTKRGYVPAGSNEFLDAIRKKSFGDFANPIL
jgi:hypothetical protein